MFNWGIIGPGRIAHKFAQGAASLEDTQIYAVASHSSEKAEAFAKEFGIEKTFTSYEDLASCDKIDAIYIATANPYHHEPAKLCLNNKKPVLLEKPITLNGKLAKEVIDTAKKTNTFFMEAMWSRFLPALVQAKEWIDEGEIGKIRMVDADFRAHLGTDPNDRWYSPDLGGGALLDLGVYAISFALMVLGTDYSEIHSVGSLINTGVDEHSAILLKYPGGEIAKVSSSLSVKPANRGVISGTEGYIELPEFWWAESAKLVKYDGTEEIIEYKYGGGGFEYEIAEVQKCVKAGKVQSNIMPWTESLAVMEIVDKAKESMGLKYPME